MPLLTIPEYRRAWETARAEEIARAERALMRERLAWFGVAIGCVLAGIGMVGMAFHTAGLRLATVWLAAAIVVGEAGPLAILIIAVRREEM